ncbi:hypothetical protein P12x_000495 [Tundrisphaera lichenicola]|uniref:hypothetical protein n=1 Tax=Tundrisphaera lichenicola TaxID=2029860 RepID=UPI003EC0FE62
MDAPRRPERADPEFDPIPLAPSRLRDFDPREHQRVVVNPFLATLVLILWWLSARWLLLDGPFPPLAVATVLILVYLPRAVQFHCLDCGRTGSYPFLDRHACSAVVSRWSSRERPRWMPPSARTQLLIWAYVIGALALLMAVTGLP